MVSASSDGSKLLISIAPRHSRRIFRGVKKYEFRRRRVRISQDTTMLVYETSPTSMVVGRCTVVRVVCLDTPQLLQLESDAVERKGLEAYLLGAQNPCALELAAPFLLERPLELAELGVRQAPQSYTFIRPV